MREAFRGLKSMQSCDGAVTMSEMSVSSRAEGSICQDRAPGCSQGKVGAECPCHNQTCPSVAKSQLSKGSPSAKIL